MSAGPIRLLRGFATVGGWTLASRVLGFLRDVMIAAYLGTGPVAEAFFVAFRLPNMFRRFFAEGAFNTAFIPLFAKRLEGEGPEAARQFAEEAMAVLLAALILLTLVAQALMPWFVLGLASGLEGERYDLAVVFSRIAFPYIVFISLAALFAGVLNSFGRFAAAAAAPVLLNLALIGAMLLSQVLAWDVGLALVWAEVLAGVAQLALLVWEARRIGMRLGLRRPRLTPQIRRLVALGFPAVLSGGVMQINLVVGTQIASYFAGAVGWLWYADRVYQLPLGVVGVAIGVVLLPELARRVRAGDAAGATAATNRATEFCLILILPCTAALVAIPDLICGVLFERGAFGPADTGATAAALAIYGLGLPAFVLQKIVSPAYFARENTRAPLRYALWSMAVNLGVALGGAALIGWQAAAWGTTLAAWANFFWLWRGAGALGNDLAIDAQLARRAPRVAAASLALGALLALGAWAGAGLPPVVLLAGLIGGGGLAYLGLARALGAFSLAEIRAGLARRPRA